VPATRVERQYSHRTLSGAAAAPQFGQFKALLVGPIPGSMLFILLLPSGRSIGCFDFIGPISPGL
jgi:hypothetical protein